MGIFSNWDDVRNSQENDGQWGNGKNRMDWTTGWEGWMRMDKDRQGDALG